MTFTKYWCPLLCLAPLLLIIGCGGEVNSVAPDPRAIEIRQAAKLKQLTTGLSLTAEQQAQVKTLLTQEAQEGEKVHAAPGQEGEDRLAKLTTLKTNTYEKIKPLLTPAQLEQYPDVLKKLEARKRR